MIAALTGNTREQPCRVCGVVREHVETFALSAGVPTWWATRAHVAPCGAPCIGGGVRPLREDERPPGVGGIDHAHRELVCGAPGCGGGRSAR